MVENSMQELTEDRTIQKYLEVLKQFVAKKSVFAQQIGLPETADYLASVFREAGAEVRLDDSFAAPFVMAKFFSSNPNAKTVIFYNHYDVQPADSDQPWTSEPFSLAVREGYLYGRGVDDDKGHITARLSAVERYKNEQGDLPVNIFFIVEGAEESASVDLEKYLDKYKEELRGADLLVWEQGIFNQAGQMVISGGTKGIVTFNAEVVSANVDIHSQFGGVVDSSSWYLLNGLSSLRDQTGRILVDGIYDDIVPASEREMDLVRRHSPVHAESLRAIYDLQLPLLTQDEDELLHRLFFEPSLTIEGLSTGYLGKGVKTIVPSNASAKLEVRLVPGMKPERVLAQIQAQLAKNGFEHIKLTYTLGEEGYRSDMTAPAILNVIEIAQRLTPSGVAVLPTTAGTGPMHQVFSALEVPIAAFGIGNPNSHDHGGDENVKWTDYLSHIEMIEELIRSYE